jgi:hypothetical protein
VTLYFHFFFNQNISSKEYNNLSYEFKNRVE